LTEPKDKPALEDLRADAKRVSEYCYKAFARPRTKPTESQ
jgi:hypothetical protein